MRRLLAVVALALAAAGCGSSGATTLSAGDYREQVGALLVRAHDRFELDPGVPLSQLEPQLSLGASVYADAQGEADKLRPPKELAAVHRQLVAALGAVHAALERSAADARAGHPQAALADLGRLATAENRVSALVVRINRLGA